MLFRYFHSRSGPRESNELLCVFVISHTDVTATAKTSDVCLPGFHPTKTHLESGECFAEKLLFKHCLCIVVISTLIRITDNKVGSSCVLSR